MRNLFLAVALALGLGFAATGAQAAAIGSNVAGLEAVAKTGNPVVEKTYYRRGWGHRRYWRHGYYHRGWGRGYYHRGWGWRHHRYWRYHHRRHYWR